MTNDSLRDRRRAQSTGDGLLPVALVVVFALGVIFGSYGATSGGEQPADEEWVSCTIQNASAYICFSGGGVEIHNENSSLRIEAGLNDQESSGWINMSNATIHERYH